MKVLSLTFALVLAECILAAPSKDIAHKVKETVIPPRGWKKHSPAPKDVTIELRLALPQPNFSELEKHLYEVSDPTHHRYGEHLSKEEVEELVAPHPESLRLVDEWLVSHGLPVESFIRSPAQDWVKIIVPVGVAEEMLDTEYHLWVHEKSGKSAIRTTSWSLPEFLFDHIEVAHPTTYFPSTKSMTATFHISPDVPPTEANAKTLLSSLDVPSAHNGQVDPECNNNITISCLQQIYNMKGYVPTQTHHNRIGLTGYLEQFANIADLQSFYAYSRPEAVGSSFNVVDINGGQNSQNLSEAGVEANLDTQYAFGLTFPTPGTFFTVGGSPPIDIDNHTPTNTNEPYQDWVDYMLGHPNPPQTVSTSYGDDEQTVPESYARRVCNGFAQLGARGVSLLFSSGDFGVGDGNPDPETQVCQTNDGRNVTRFIPTFPATCPFVTSVGGTIKIPEVAVDFSGGGFSDLFSTPSYQQEAVNAFLQQLPEGTYPGLFNPSGRGFPDISAQSERFIVFVGGQRGHVGGTSASAPTVAAIISNLNDARLAHGFPPLGFLNPLLYKIQHSGALNDITSGNNPGCGTQGFNATAGWDPLTGLGTPNFGKLKDIVLSH
ncbi:tripeptidyl peptidase A [Abortiporus biennis]|nr:tripeptidyl peptidase A [Abortiporus biennis]